MISEVRQSPLARRERIDAGEIEISSDEAPAVAMLATSTSGDIGARLLAGAKLGGAVVPSGARSALSTPLAQMP